MALAITGSRRSLSGPAPKSLHSLIVGRRIYQLIARPKPQQLKLVF